MYVVLTIAGSLSTAGATRGYSGMHDLAAETGDLWTLHNKTPASEAGI